MNIKPINFQNRNYNTLFKSQPENKTATEVTDNKITDNNTEHTNNKKRRSKKEIFGGITTIALFIFVIFDAIVEHKYSVEQKEKNKALEEAQLLINKRMEDLKKESEKLMEKFDEDLKKESKKLNDLLDELLNNNKKI